MSIKSNPIDLVKAGILFFLLPYSYVYAAEEDDLIEKITVTSQKRVEKLSEVPVAVSVLRSEQIDASFTNGIEGLQNLVPSVSFRKGTTNRNSAITVRGIGTISFSVAAEPSVSTVVDGVVLGRSGQAFTELYDLERIEVLRGPQGTLFGKNASAGVVNITTKKPTADFETQIETTLFQDDEHRIKVKAGGEIATDLNASLMLYKADFDGYIHNTFNGNTVNGYDKEGIRNLITYDFNSDLSMLMIMEYMESDDDCCADIEGLPSGRNPNSPAVPNSQGIINNIADIDLNQRLIDHDFATRTQDKTKSISVQFDQTLGDYNLTSITAYREWDNDEFREGDFTSIGGGASIPVFEVPFQLHDIGTQSWEQTSQEFRIQSPLGNNFEYQVGFFYWNIESSRQFTRFASCQNNAGQNQAILDANPGLSCLANDIVSATAFMETEFDNWAVFGQGKYHLTEELSLLLGLRYTDDEVSYEHRRINLDSFGRRGVGVREAALNTNFKGSTDKTNTSTKLGLQYQLNELGMLYASWSEGYKGPGFNVFYNMAEKDTAAIGEETSDAYELGYKFAMANFMINAAIFKTEIEGFQANNFDDSSGVTITRLTNAGNVTTEGVEIDFLWQTTENLNISGGLAKVNAEIEEFFCPDGTTCTDRAGLAVPFAPDLKYSLAAEYVYPLAMMDVIINTSYSYTDEQQSTLPNNDGTLNPAALLPDYALWDASVGLSFAEDTYRLTFIAKNLTDKQYLTAYSGDNFRYQVPRNAERYFGLQFRANFY